jgi:hypothetical protein
VSSGALLLTSCAQILARYNLKSNFALSKIGIKWYPQNSIFEFKDIIKNKINCGPNAKLKEAQFCTKILGQKAVISKNSSRQPLVVMGSLPEKSGNRPVGVGRG